MALTAQQINKLIEFRKQLHRYPELSGNEKQTAKAIVDFIKPTNPTTIIKGIGGHGVAAVYHIGKPGPTVLLRADMDALPIQEAGDKEHKSTVSGVAHLCGHDGHTAILAGVAHALDINSLTKGKLVLLFQPAEETGAGAAAIINDPKFKQIVPDYAFALHNLPGYPLGTIVVKEGTFTSASTGIKVNLKGFPSHAAHPEDGNNPDRALAKLIMELNSLNDSKDLFSDFVLLTIVHARLGKVAFGTTPGNATLMATLRTFKDEDMHLLKKRVEELVESICKQYGLDHIIGYTEEFPATVNHKGCAETLINSGQQLDYPIINLELPHRWSEDFGHFGQICPSALFGVGVGENHPQLHNEDYDFPDELIEPSVKLFVQIAKSLLR